MESIFKTNLKSKRISKWINVFIFPSITEIHLDQRKLIFISYYPFIFQRNVLSFLFVIANSPLNTSMFEISLIINRFYE